jgi:hypothetical protein
MLSNPLLTGGFWRSRQLAMLRTIHAVAMNPNEPSWRKIIIELKDETNFP